MERTAKPSLGKRMAKMFPKVELPILIMMAKGAVAPTIGLAIYQNTKVAQHFSTIGYLIPIFSILTVPVMPRARFIQNMVVTILLVSLAAAMSILAMWIAVKARENTTHLPKSSSNGPVPGAQVHGFNAAASANMGIWLFFWVWMANTFRAYRPQYFLPSIVFSIFFNITATYGTQFATMAEAEALVKRLLEAFFSGFAISAAVSIFVIPFSSRDIMKMRIVKVVSLYKTVLEAQNDFIHSIPRREWYGSREGSKTFEGVGESENISSETTTDWPEAHTLKRATIEAAEGVVEVQTEVRYAKREFAWGKLGTKDYGTMYKMLKGILSPLLGLESIVEVTDRIEKRGGWQAANASCSPQIAIKPEENTLEEKEKDEWIWLFEKLHGPVEQLKQAMIEGIDHASCTLEITKRPKSPPRADIEAKGYGSSLDGNECAAHLEKSIRDFIQQREAPLREWCTSKGMDEPSDKSSSRQTNYPLHQRHQAQLYLVLDLEYSFLATARAILALVKYADSKVEDGTMKKKRLIVPSFKALKKWFWASVAREDSNLDYQAFSTRSGTVTVNLGDALQTNKDPEHLPPVTAWEKFTDNFRYIPKFFGSPESAFGFRVATATMVIAIAAFLRNSQQFFIEQRIIWGSIMVAISMTQTAGSGIYGQFLRFGGTALAMVVAYIDWYVVDQHTAGVIVFFGIIMFLYHYLLVTQPDNPVVPMIGMVTVTLIVGYALQVKQVGLAISESNGQAYHPLYELAPYRLLAVGGGVLTAFIFTYFPSVITARAMLRKDLGSCIYLLANYYSSVYATVVLRIRGIEGDFQNKKSPGKVLEKARARVLAKELVLLQGMRQHCKFNAWEPTFGGRFPAQTYDKLICHTQNILHFTAIIANVSESFRSNPDESDPTSQSPSQPWLNNFKKLMISMQMTFHEVTSLLAMISGAISTGKPLPPFLKLQSTYDIGKLLEELDKDILSTRHVCEPGYSAFAVMQVATKMLVDDLNALLSETKTLVGEVDFSVDVVKWEDLEGDMDPMRIKED